MLDKERGAEGGERIGREGSERECVRKRWDGVGQRRRERGLETEKKWARRKLNILYVEKRLHAPV